MWAPYRLQLTRCKLQNTVRHVRALSVKQVQIAVYSEEEKHVQTVLYTVRVLQVL